MKELIKDLEELGFKLTFSEKCDKCINYIFNHGTNGSAEVIKISHFTDGSTWITEWLVKDLIYKNMQLNLICDISTYYQYIHLEDLIK